MGFLDRLFGGGADEPHRAAGRPAFPPPASGSRDAGGRYAPPPPPGVPGSSSRPTADDTQALERYRYLLRTAPPETVEQVHAEAFARLTPGQRQQVLQELSSGLPASERPAGDDPAALARAATRAEYTRPGFMERTFGNRSFGGGAPGFGSMLGASMLGTIGGYVIGSALVGSLFDPGYAAGFEDGMAAEGPDAEPFADPGVSDAGGFGDFGGDFGF